MWIPIFRTTYCLLLLISAVLAFVRYQAAGWTMRTQGAEVTGTTSEHQLEHFQKLRAATVALCSRRNYTRALKHAEEGYVESRAAVKSLPSNDFADAFAWFAVTRGLLEEFRQTNLVRASDRSWNRDKSYQE